MYQRNKTTSKKKKKKKKKKEKRKKGARADTSFLMVGHTSSTGRGREGFGDGDGFGDRGGLGDRDGFDREDFGRERLSR